MAWFWSSQGDDEDSSEYESYSDEGSSEDGDSFEDDSETIEQEESSSQTKDLAHGTRAESAPATSNGDSASKENGLTPKAPAVETDNNEGSLREDEFNLLMDSSASSTAERKPKTTQTNGNAPEENGKEKPEETADETPLEETLDPAENGDPAEEEQEEVTTLAEKRSLLVLAAEHDRVDILQAILSSAEDDRNTLLNPTEDVPPPLHIAVHYGSVNAVNCLLRMGANPSLRPPAMTESAVEIRDLQRFCGKTAWELAFEEQQVNNGSFSSLFASTAPSKREGIRHGFTAEALRCVGADEVDRLQELLDAGLPPDSQVGGKTISEWTVEMEATKCRELLQPEQPMLSPRSSAVLRQKESSLPSLSNRLEELESLSAALSTCLDNLAEEVSVCSGLLLVGSGGAALGAHMRSLKAQNEKLSGELERLGDAWENTEDELAYWVRECGGVDILSLQSNKSRTDAEGQTTGSNTAEEERKSDQDEAATKKLKGQIAACETKIRMLQASISDLSEENSRNLEAIKRRNLTGAVTLVRKLREEIRDLEFRLSECKSAEAASRAKIQLLQQYHAKHGKLVAPPAVNESQTTSDALVEAEPESIGAKPDHSTAIIVRPKHGNNGFLPMSIWNLLLRIIGFNPDGGDTPATRPAIIV